MNWETFFCWKSEWALLGHNLGVGLPACLTNSRTEGVFIIVAVQSGATSGSWITHFWAILSIYRSLQPSNALSSVFLCSKWPQWIRSTTVVWLGPCGTVPASSLTPVICVFRLAFTEVVKSRPQPEGKAQSVLWVMPAFHQCRPPQERERGSI